MVLDTPLSIDTQDLLTDQNICFNQPLPIAILNPSNRKYHDLESRTYGLPCDEEELDRLNLQHSNFVTVFDGLVLNSVKNDIRPGSKVIDLGCGTGAWILDMAKAYPDSKFFGVDIADVFPKHDLPPNISFSIMDISKPLTFEKNSFDFINARLIIVSITEERWPTILKECYNILKPGGLVQFMEYDHIASNGDENTMRFVRGLYGAMKKNHQDFFVSNKLSGLLRFAGFNNVKEDRRILELNADGTELSKRILENWTRALIGFRPFILPFICPNDPDSYDLLLEENIKGCIEQRWFKQAVGVTGMKPLV
ncbi:S-adenosyl-L-methionine-dependent methyltransferase [Phycomyces blakesleeanus]